MHDSYVATMILILIETTQIQELEGQLDDETKLKTDAQKALKK